MPVAPRRGVGRRLPPGHRSPGCAAATSAVGAIPHATFHHEAGKIAGLINQTHYASVEAALESGAAYSQATSSVVVGICKLEREAAL